MYYQRMIQEELVKIGASGFAPRHIEAYMRLAHGTLDALSKKQFCDEIEIAIACIMADGQDNAESLARSYGL